MKVLRRVKNSPVRGTRHAFFSEAKVSRDVFWQCPVHEPTWKCTFFRSRDINTLLVRLLAFGRWCQVYEQRIRYFSDSSCADLKGQIETRDLTKIAIDSTKSRLGFSIHIGQQTFHFVAPSSLEQVCYLFRKMSLWSCFFHTEWRHSASSSSNSSTVGSFFLGISFCYRNQSWTPFLDKNIFIYLHGWEAPVCLHPHFWAANYIPAIESRITPSQVLPHIFFTKVTDNSRKILKCCVQNNKHEFVCASAFVISQIGFVFF